MIWDAMSALCVGAIIVALFGWILTGIFAASHHFGSRPRSAVFSFLNGPSGPWAGPMLEMGMAVLTLRRPPFLTFRDLGGPQAFTAVPICAQQWAETASKRKVRKLLQAVRKEAEFCLLDHRQQEEVDQIIAGQRWAEMAKREEIMKLLKAVRKEALRYLEKSHFPPEYLKEQYYLYQICQEDSTLLLAILDGRILVGRK